MFGIRTPPSRRRRDGGNAPDVSSSPKSSSLESGVVGNIGNGGEGSSGGDAVPGISQQGNKKGDNRSTAVSTGHGGGKTGKKTGSLNPTTFGAGLQSSGTRRTSSLSECSHTESIQNQMQVDDETEPKSVDTDPPRPKASQDANYVGKVIGKLDESVFRPFGSNMNVSALSSNSSESANCPGGPLTQCGKPVTDDPSDEGVQCDNCKNWYHSKCQALPTQAWRALNKFKQLMWNCCKCCDEMGAMQLQKSISKKLQRLELASSEHAEQMKAVAIQHAGVLLEKMNTLETIQKKLQETISHIPENALDDAGMQAHHAKPTFSEIVKGSCDKVITTLSEKIQAIPKESTEDILQKERRKYNIVVHNLPEPQGNTRKEVVTKDCETVMVMCRDVMHLNTRITSSYRVGQRQQGKARLLIATLDSEATKWDIIRSAPLLQDSPRWEGIYINPDLTPAEREAAKVLREKLSTRRKNGEKDLVIRNKKIVVSPGADERYQERCRRRSHTLLQAKSTPGRNLDLLAPSEAVNGVRPESIQIPERTLQEKNPDYAGAVSMAVPSEEVADATAEEPSGEVPAGNPENSGIKGADQKHPHVEDPPGVSPVSGISAGAGGSSTTEPTAAPCPIGEEPGDGPVGVVPRAINLEEPPRRPVQSLVVTNTQRQSRKVQKQGTGGKY